MVFIDGGGGFFDLFDCRENAQPSYLSAEFSCGGFQVGSGCTRESWWQFVLAVAKVPRFTLRIPPAESTWNFLAFEHPIPYLRPFQPSRF
ncbi:hypothetical protein U1Q18_048125 [Sarracenia purpurea var. burkii]